MEYLQNIDRCSKCFDKYDIFDKEPPCETCSFNFRDGKELDIDNIVAFRVWRLVYNQVLISLDGPIDINVSTVIDTMSLFDVPKKIKLETLNTIVECWRYFNTKIKQQETRVTSKARPDKIKNKGKT